MTEKVYRSSRGNVTRGQTKKKEEEEDTNIYLSWPRFFFLLRLLSFPYRTLTCAYPEPHLAPQGIARSLHSRWITHSDKVNLQPKKFIPWSEHDYTNRKKHRNTVDLMSCFMFRNLIPFHFNSFPLLPSLLPYNHNSTVVKYLLQVTVITRHNYVCVSHCIDTDPVVLETLWPSQHWIAL